MGNQSRVDQYAKADRQLNVAGFEPRGCGGWNPAEPAACDGYNILRAHRATLYPGLLLYRGILWLALPFVMLRLWWRGRRDPAYRPRWQERFGFYTGPQTQGAVWFHTVSAGETIAAAPSIRAMAVDDDNGPPPVLVTTMTPTGSEQVTALLGDAVGHCYAPYDFTFAVRRFLTEVNPRALILMETEIWPNLILEAKARGIPVMLVNARLSEKSAQGYQRLAGSVVEYSSALT